MDIPDKDMILNAIGWLQAAIDSDTPEEYQEAIDGACSWVAGISAFFQGVE